MARALLLLALLVSPALACLSAMELIESSTAYSGCLFNHLDGKRTICSSFDVDRHGARAAITAAGGDFNAVVSGGCLLPAQCLSLLAQQVEAFYSAQLELHDTHCECVDAALTDILFASGSVVPSAELSSVFTALESGQYAQAGSALLSSTFCATPENKARCQNDADIIKAGC